MTLPRRQPLSTSDRSGHAVSGLSSVMLTVTLVGFSDARAGREAAERGGRAVALVRRDQGSTSWIRPAGFSCPPRGVSQAIRRTRPTVKSVVTVVSQDVAAPGARRLVISVKHVLTGYGEWFTTGALWR